MLGALIREAKGKLVSTRTSGESGQIEGIVQERGKILGIDDNTTGRFRVIHGPEGTLHGEIKRFTICKDGNAANSKGSIVGLLRTHKFAASFKGLIYYQSSSLKLARLNGLAVALEGEIDENGNLVVNEWEQK